MSIHNISDTDTDTLRLKSAMVLYALETALGDLVRKSGISPIETNFELVKGILSREDLDDLEDGMEGLDDRRLVAATISATYLDEIFQIAIETNRNSIQGERLNQLKEWCELLSIFEIRNAISHPNRPFPECFWFRMATIGSDPVINQLGLSKVSEAMRNASKGRVESLPDEWLNAHIWSLPNNLPQYFDHKVTGLIGRRKPFSDLKKFVFNPRVSNTAIVGPGGLGKTALALEFLESICLDPSSKDDFDGLVFISLKQHFLTAVGMKSIDATSTLEELAFEVSEAINSLYDADDSSYDDVKENFGKKRLLLCIDNLETLLIDHQTLFRQFFLELPAAWKLLVTSRVQVSEFSSVSLGPIEQKFAESLAKSYTAKTSSLKFSNDEFSLIAETMNQNPLAIKLTIDACNLGRTLPEAMHGTERDVVAFSYDGLLGELSEEAIIILECLFLQEPLSRNEICEILEDLDYDKIAEAVIELVCTSLVNRQPRAKGPEGITLSPGIRDYLRVHPKNIELRGSITARIKRSQSIALDVVDAQESMKLNQHHPDYIPEEMPSNLTKIIYTANRALNRAKTFGTTALLPSLTELSANRSLYDGHGLFHRTYARILREYGDFTDAIDHFNRAVELEPESLLSHFLLSRAYQDSGKPELAEQQLENLGIEYISDPDNSSKVLSRNMLSTYLNSKIYQHKYVDVLGITASWRDSEHKLLLGGQRANCLKRASETIRLSDGKQANAYLEEALTIMDELFQQFGLGNLSNCGRSIKIIKDCIHSLEVSGIAMNSHLAEIIYEFSNKYLRKICDSTQNSAVLEDISQRLAKLDFENNPFRLEKWRNLSVPRTHSNEAELAVFRDKFRSQGYTQAHVVTVGRGNNLSKPPYCFASNGDERYHVSAKSLPAEQFRSFWGNIGVGQELAIILEPSESGELLESSDTQILDFWCAWERAYNLYPTGTRTQGTIVNIADYGVFVELPDGTTGLLHISKILGLEPGTPLEDVFERGQEIEVIVDSIDKERHRISLSLKMAS